MKRVTLILLLCLGHLYSSAQIPAAGNILWLKADIGVFRDNSITPTPYGDLVQVWEDQSGNGNHFSQPTSSFRPQLVIQPALFCGKPSIRFDVSRRTYLASALKSSGSKTVFIVFKVNALAGTPQSLLTIKGLTTTYTEVMITDHPAYRSISYIANVPGSVSGGTMINSSGMNVSFSGAGNIATIVYNGGTISSPGSYQNKYDTVSASVSSSGLFGRLMNDTSAIGARAPEHDYAFFNGDMAEIIAYDRVLASAEMTQVQNYLVSKYGFYNSCIVLPVRLVDFKAIQEERSIGLHWMAGDENNVARYIIEHSMDGINWKTIDTKTPEYRSFTSEYHMIHPYPVVGINYYRIAIVSVDGKQFYSSVRLADFKETEETGIQILPNPFTSYILIRTAKPERFSIIVSDVQGRRITQITTFNNERVELPEMRPGIYFIKVLSRSGERLFRLARK